MNQNRETLIKLKLIGGLKIGNKLSTRYLQIQQDSLSTKLYRWAFNENRTHTVVFCRNTITQAQFLLTTSIDEKLKAEIKEDLKTAKQGLQNLQETYGDCLRTYSELLEIIQTIEREAG